MSEAGSVQQSYMWTANDWSNIVTISSAALASVLLVVFKSRCSKISICWGLWSCDRVVQDQSDDENDQRADAIQNQQVNGDVFTASCDVEPMGCTLVWLFLLMSMMVHAMRYCGSYEYASSEDEEKIPTMYTP